MVAARYIVGIVGNIVSVLIFASPIPTFWRIVKRGSTEDFEGLPYVSTLLEAALWVYYGLTKPGAILIATVNILGTVMELIYVILFIMYAPPRVRAKTVIWVAFLDVGFFGLTFLATRFAMDGDFRISVIGFVCAGLCIVMYGSPLSIMRTVITTKSVEYMPFLLSFVLFVNAAVWTTYSILTKDLFVMVPNGLGFLLGLAQLILYAMYMNHKDAKSRVQGLEEGRQPLIQPAEVHETGDVKNKISSNNNTTRLP
ncbi:hypothetical protein MRB53_032146 [Persea americana]|uniref:Uncharacterized protein n=2 Tax=Persea americana TaxID=3435 RepID=A0ACC2KRE0_PERAE|nr:hypothetical protein MRB53_031759 [Persea americana]KAJ8623617.1 hypothetical protein MRB53_032146 [Persea americana]